MRTIKSRVSGLKKIPWAKLKTYEFNDLKEVENRDIEKLKRAIITDGFCFPVEVWKGHNYVIDGRGRDEALLSLESEGYKIPSIPVVEIEAPDREAAKRLVLMRSSQHGRFTQAQLESFTSDIDVANLDMVVNIPGLDIGVLGSELEDAVPPEDFETYDEEIETEHRCPSCGYEW